MARLLEVLLTKNEMKRARRRYVKRKKQYGKRKDTDKDGTPDYRDGHPRNPKKHSFFAAFVTGAGTALGSAIVAKNVRRRRIVKK